MARYFPFLYGGVILFTAVVLSAGFSGTKAQDQPPAQDQTPANVLHLYNRACGPLEVVILNDDEECPESITTCKLTINDGERQDVQVAGVLPAALNFLVDGRCEGDRPTLISGQCVATLISLSPKHPAEDSSSLESAIAAPCLASDDACPQIEGGDIRKKMRTQVYRTIDFELGLCDAQDHGPDRCQIQCKVQ